MYFGYTSCPDVCPTTLADTRTALERLGDGPGRVNLAMATIDPDRDTDDVLSSYVRSFIPDAHALRTTDEAALRAAADVFGVSYSVTENADGETDVSHTGSLYAVDDQGNLLVSWPFGVTIDDLARDLEILLDRA